MPSFVKYAINHNLNVAQQTKSSRYNKGECGENEKFKSQIFIISIWFPHSLSISVHLIFYFRFPFKILSSESTFLLHLFHHYSLSCSLSLCFCLSFYVFFVCVLKCMSASWCKLFKDYPAEKKLEHGKKPDEST